MSTTPVSPSLSRGRSENSPEILGTEAQRLQTDDTTAISSTAVTEFLQRTKIPIGTVQPATKAVVEERVLAGAKQWHEKGLSASRYEPHYTTSINMATVAYGHTHVDVQVQIALFTLLALCVDDLQVSREALEAFSTNLYTGAPQLDPVLNCLIDNLTHMPEFFLPYASKSIVVATIEFVNATLFDMDTSGMTLHDAALPYVEYKRLRNALGGAYGFFVWDKFSFPDVSVHIQVIPETMIFLNYANDILSFYKEELAGERDNYIHDRSRITKEGVPAVLKHVVQEVVASVDRAREILKGEKEKETWERFLAAYVAYHYMSPRYRLAELVAADSL
ncbi:terpenoid synthase [Trametopsis cervina]|nr:terpenoid synthase [Trametopsis cervina]